jgi:hypothetical protein
MRGLPASMMLINYPFCAMKTTPRLFRFRARACARRHYVDPILFEDGFYKSRLEAAELYLSTAARIRRREPGYLPRQPDSG